ncbi:hypothetical protein AAV94_10005 [Lampropedia cohaerens]|uniref:SAM-dependent methyltransferase n=1 Tax=Lampropedia cohaerens TaxID=1610491 RepID=A0A0U1PY93_9BURK|nr:SAM-dependent methyltransferase [Lampropedia cohaerens]KKW67490.1 hypothetical protein AAV94_10005 [Lampropedia cohaerens]
MHQAFDEQPESVTAALTAQLHSAIAAGGGWLPFDAFMQMALYAPGLGYYSHARRKIGRMPARGDASEGSDFVTAPELSALFGRTLARQIAQALDHYGCDTVFEFGAGNGTLARDVLDTLGEQVRRYCIVDVSHTLRARQAERLQAHAGKIEWLSELPDCLEGVLLGNEVLDAMPVKLLAFQDGQWHERGVALDAQQQLVWHDRPTALRPPVDLPLAPQQGYVTEIHPWAEAFIRTTAERLRRGAALWIDYGFGEREYYHPQRNMGTLVAHHQHRVDDDVLTQIGEKDITSHVNFTGIAVAAQEAGLEVLGYTSQARFLINCGIQPLLDAATLAQRAMAARLLHEHEMGELFKVMMLGTGPFWEPLGFSAGDRTHTL